MERGFNWYLSVLALVFSGCLEPYAPPVSGEDVDVLVVDGFLDASTGEATITLSRAVPLTASDNFPMELGALVSVTDDTGGTYPLSLTGEGIYRASGIVIDPNKQYRVQITTQTGDEYVSDLTNPIHTPPIDSVTWITDDEKLTIRVNAHDNTNQTRYFRWTFEETWSYHADVLSLYKVVDKTPEPRMPDEMIYYCWRTQPSTNIVIGSTAKLRENVISQIPVNFISKGSKKVSMKYSIQVTQRSISEEEYLYLEQLKRTTESIGGLFDPQPSQVIGNIHRVSSSSPMVVGYFGVGNTVRERIFIGIDELPLSFIDIPRTPGCYPPDTVCVNVPSNMQCALAVRDLTSSHMLGYPISQGISIVGYTLTSAKCADCRYEGGETVKPDFWP